MKKQETFRKITQAITCPPAKNFAEMRSSTADAPDYQRALEQHQAYCDVLKKCGVAVTSLDARLISPDSCFVNNVALVTEYLAVIGNFPDDGYRHAEQKEIAAALAGNKFLKFVTPPGYLSCTDVLQLDNHFYISLSHQTNQEGAAQLAFFLNEYGYQVTMLDIGQDPALRLGQSVAWLGNNTILIREELSRHFSFLEYERIIVPKNERGATNSILVNGTILMPTGYPQTLEKLRALDLPVLEVNVSEFEKLGAGLSCLSLRMPKQTKDSGLAVPTQKTAG